MLTGEPAELCFECIALWVQPTGPATDLIHTGLPSWMEIFTCAKGATWVPKSQIPPPAIDGCQHNDFLLFFVSNGGQTFSFFNIRVPPNRAQQPWVALNRGIVARVPTSETHALARKVNLLPELFKSF